MTARSDSGAVLAVGFGTTVAMWTVGYFFRMPGLEAPGWVLLALMLLTMLAGGAHLGARSSLGALGGAKAGALTALLNLLILGSLLGEGTTLSQALIWVPGAVAFGAVVGAAGAFAGGRLFRASFAARESDWTSQLTLAGAGATFLLVVAGGLVTSLDAGLAVPDWPNTFGATMFLYPLSRMTGGVYFEHAHRLLGALVGLTAIAVAFRVLRSDPRRGVKLAAVAGVAFVIVQGILGGLRVTGSFTMSADASELAPSLWLAVVHGISGQVFFAWMCGLAVVTSPMWKDRSIAAPQLANSAVRLATQAVPLLLVGQLVLGALVRHRSAAMMAHIGGAAIVGFVALFAGVAFWGSVRDPQRVSRIGLALIGATMLQVTLGFVAFAVTGGGKGLEAHAVFPVLTISAHQANGALLLAVATMAALWCARERWALGTGAAHESVPVKGASLDERAVG